MKMKGLKLLIVGCIFLALVSEGIEGGSAISMKSKLERKQHEAAYNAVTSKPVSSNVRSSHNAVSSSNQYSGILEI
jgi:hypothetical protein